MEGANEATVARTLAVALSATLVALTLGGVVGLWWALLTAEWRQVPDEADVERDQAPKVPDSGASAP